MNRCLEMQFNFVVYFFGLSCIVSYREEVKANESDIKESVKVEYISAYITLDKLFIDIKFDHTP